MFGAIFMATDPVTSPTTKNATILYGISLGILTVAFRYLTSFPEGVMTSILTMNMLVFILDKIGATSSFNKKKLLIPIIVLIVLASYVTFTAISDLKVPSNVDKDFKIIEVKESDNKIIYTATEKGYESIIKANITFENNKVIKIEILEENDSFFDKVEKANYIDYLIDNQNNLDNVDTITGATYSSNGLLKMLKNTMKDYGENYEK